MAPSVPSVSQRRILGQLLVAYPRQRSFEKQASLQYSLRKLPAKSITAWYIEQQRIKEEIAFTTQGQEASPTSSPAPASPTSNQTFGNVKEESELEDVEMKPPPSPPVAFSSGELVRPGFPPRSSPGGSPTTTPNVIQDIDEKPKPVEELEEEAEPREGWKREHKPQAPLTVSIECSGAIEITTRHEDTIYRLRVPLTQLSHLTLQDSRPTLSLLLPPDYYQRPIATPGQPKSQWKSCDDFTANGDASYTSIFLIELNPDHSSTRELRESQLIKPLMLVLPPTPADLKKDFLTFPSITSVTSSGALQPALHIAEAAQAPTPRLLLAAHPQNNPQPAIFHQSDSRALSTAPVYAIPHPCACTVPSSFSSPSPTPPRNLPPPPHKIKSGSISPAQEERELEAWEKATGGRVKLMEETFSFEQLWSDSGEGD
ncbi:hypothetical protein BCR35DRAFT_331349 [Leucosporidium creatinivorum]|uniref:Uncharacterized protein n=1 Tax=Leucosporidium creatinivorum TaxID=106004 RepID=A0A1Y2FGA7_9BASI|nr:hypothetical protein BCR35DRAFT_331349 [Leucosporidium creatinivorum]